MQVEDLLTFGGLKTAEIVAGYEGMERVVESISVLEVAESSISTWVVKNQLYITSFYAIKDDLEMQKIVIETLNRCGCCGLVICHLDLILKEIVPAIISLCNKLRFPLILAQSSTSYIEILNPIIGQLKMDEDFLHDRGMVRDEMLKLLLEEQELPDILKSISYRAKREISFFDIQFNCLYSNKGDIEKEDERTFLIEYTPWENKKLSTLKYKVSDICDKQKMLYFIKTKSHFLGVMIVNLKMNEDEKEVFAIAEELNLPCAILFSRKKRILSTEYNYRQEYVSDLLVWNFRSPEVALTRGRELGMDIQSKCYVMVLNINAFQKTKDKKKVEELDHYIRYWFMPNVNEIAYSYNRDSIVHYRSDTILFLLCEELIKGELHRLARNLIALFDNNKHTTISIGIGNVMKRYDEIPRAYNEAFDTAILGRNYCGENQIVYCQNLWILQHLKQLKHKAEMAFEGACILQPLIDSDKDKGTELIATVRTLFECKLDYTVAAERLFIHRNTLLYRKNRMIDLLGYNPFEIPYSFNIFAAIFLYEELQN